MKKILVTPRSVTRDGHPSLERLSKAGFELVFSRPGESPSEEELCGLLPGCIGYLAGVEPIRSNTLEEAEDLKAISRNGTGVDSVDMEAANRLGIQVLRAQGANARGVAELTMALMLSLARSLTVSDRTMKSGQWERCPGFELEGKTLGLIGCGRIGKFVTHFSLAFGMRVLAYDPIAQWDNAPKGFSFATLDEIYEQSEIISLHCPLSADGRPILNREEIGRLKKGVCIINTARSGLIDTDAMLEALNGDHVAGLGLDVFNEEPPKDRRLVEHARVIATPHIGGYTPQSIDRAMTIAVDNLLQTLSPT